MGRDRELATLDGELAALGSGGSCAIAITGEAGIGKSRLLAALTAAADERGHTVLAARATELERHRPLGVVVDALDDYLAALPADELDPLGPARLAELGRLFPALAPVQPIGGTGRHGAHHAVRSLLELLAARRPLVLALDDLHWADDAALELVSYLLRRPPRAPVLLALAFR
ncbi:MAG: ATP-binding protein, partial [Pseudonocardia sp.]|nr:ATP-binding protein [Pseudonocardia sp.]